jgi:hypothetical protein
MIVLGLLLILVAAGIAVFALVSSSNYTTQIPLHGIGLSFTATPLAIYLAGAVSVIFIGLGFALILRGTGRQWGRHQEHKELKQLRNKDATAAARTADGSANDSTATSDSPAKIPDRSTGNGSDTNTDTPLGRHRDTE